VFPEQQNTDFVHIAGSEKPVSVALPHSNVRRRC
jgi:hypothetical protein